MPPIMSTSPRIPLSRMTRRLPPSWSARPCTTPITRVCLCRRRFTEQPATSAPTRPVSARCPSRSRRWAAITSTAPPLPPARKS